MFKFVRRDDLAEHDCPSDPQIGVCARRSRWLVQDKVGPVQGTIMVSRVDRYGKKTPSQPGASVTSWITAQTLKKVADPRDKQTVKSVWKMIILNVRPKFRQDIGAVTEIMNEFTMRMDELRRSRDVPPAVVIIHPQFLSDLYHTAQLISGTAVVDRLMQDLGYLPAATASPTSTAAVYHFAQLIMRPASHAWPDSMMNAARLVGFLKDGDRACMEPDKVEIVSADCDIQWDLVRELTLRHPEYLRYRCGESEQVVLGKEGVLLPRGYPDLARWFLTHGRIEECSLQSTVRSSRCRAGVIILCLAFLNRVGISG